MDLDMYSRGATVMRSLYRSVVVKRELSRKALVGLRSPPIPQVLVEGLIFTNLNYILLHIAISVSTGPW